MQGENDNGGDRGDGPYLASARALLAPTLVIVAGYAACLGLLVLSGRGDGALARLCIVVIAIGGPLLLAYAVLRRATIRVEARRHALFLNEGIPRAEPFEIPWLLVAGAHVVRGPLGRLTGSGTLVVELRDGHRMVARDLADPSGAAGAVRRGIEGAASTRRRIQAGHEVETARSTA